jgi:hypothetical protein
MAREFAVMLRRLAPAILALLVLVSPCFGQEWAKKMFKATDHDFGVVARGAKTEYRFVFQNIYLEDIHIANAYASCGCTSVRIENPLVKTYEKGAIVAILNTANRSGQWGATIHVVIDQPFYAEVQLQDRGYIRNDVDVQPGSVQVGAIDQGAGGQQTVAVNYNGGRSDWRIVEVKSSNPHVTATVNETGNQNSRYYGQANYTLKVSVDKTAPAGTLNDCLTLVTNDATGGQIPVLVEGRVTPSIAVPTALYMGVVPSGQKVTRPLMVTGKKPFRILDIQCDDKSFQFQMPKNDVAKQRHLISVTFAAGTDAGKVVRTIKIKTDQGTMTPELSAYAVVTTAQ